MSGTVFLVVLFGWQISSFIAAVLFFFLLYDFLVVVVSVLWGC